MQESRSSEGSIDTAALLQSVELARDVILLHRLPTETPKERLQLAHEQEPTLRGQLWQLLILGSCDKNDEESSVKVYEKLLLLGKSRCHDKICDDSFRTFRSDKEFLSIVSEAALIRFLDAFVHMNDVMTTGKGAALGYKQGMNTIAGILLRVMPEPQALSCFSKIVTEFCPAVYNSTLQGAHNAVTLCDECLKLLDPELAFHLQSHGLTGHIYAFAPLLSFQASIPPLREVLNIWDYMVAFGFHLNVIFTCAYFIYHRGKILAADKPIKVVSQRNPFELVSGPVISVAMHLLSSIPKELYSRIVSHMR